VAIIQLVLRYFYFNNFFKTIIFYLMHVDSVTYDIYYSFCKLIIQFISSSSLLSVDAVLTCFLPI